MEREFEGLKADDITFTSKEEDPTEETNETAETTGEDPPGETVAETTGEETEPETPEGEKETADAESSKSEQNTETGTDSPAETAPGLDTLLSEKSGGKFKSYQDLENHIEELKANQKTEAEELDNDLISRFKEFRTGRNGDAKEIARQFLETQILDIEGMDAMEAIRTRMKFAHPNRSAEDIDFLIKNKYKLDEEEFEANEIRLSKLQMEDDATEARKELKELQQKAALKERKVSENHKQQEEEIRQANEKWQRNVDVTLKEFERMEFNLGEEEKFNFGVEKKDEIKGILSNLPGFWNRYVSQDKDGNVVEHIDRLRDDMTLLTHREEILKAVFDHGRSKGRDEIIKERKNPTQKDHKEATETPKAKSELEEAAEGLAAQLR